MPPTTPLSPTPGVAVLLRRLREAGARNQISTLLGRDPAAHVAPDYPYPVAVLIEELEELREAGGHQQVIKLADRAAGDVFLKDQFAVGVLLHQLREAGDYRQADRLAARLPRAGMFELFREQEGNQDRFPFGREAYDGSPAERWEWEDLH